MSLQDAGISAGTDKARFGYLPIYEKYISKYRDTEDLNILEIGILGGSSLHMWRQYFPNARVMGADIQPHGRNIRGEMVNSSFFDQDENSKFYLCDQSKEDQLKEMCESIVRKTGKGIDVFVDDGSHFQPDMMLTLGVVFPYLEKGGVFIIEDICTQENLAKGAKWWGSDQQENLEDCVERTLERFVDGGKMTSSYLSKDMLEYLNNNVSSCDIYKAQIPPLTPQGTSSVAILTK